MKRTDSMIAAGHAAERRFPGLFRLLWQGNVIHGEQVLALVPRGFNAQMADVSTTLLRLHAAGVLRPLAFRPSPSGAAFLGLSPAYRGHQTAPNAGTAGHWTWECLGDFDQP